MFCRYCLYESQIKPGERREGRVLRGSQFEVTVYHRGQELETDGHTASTFRKQVAMNDGTQLTLYFLYS